MAWRAEAGFGSAQRSVAWLDVGHGLPKPGMAQLHTGQSSAWHSMAQLGPRPSLSQPSWARSGVVWHGWAQRGVLWHRAYLGTTWASFACHDPAGHGLPWRGTDWHSLVQHSMAKPTMVPAWQGWAQHSLAWHSLARHSSAWHGCAQPGLAQFGSAWFGILGHSMARPDPTGLGTARPGAGWDAPCLLTLPDPGEIFQLASFRWFPCSPGSFSRCAAWLPASRARGEAGAHVLLGDRGTALFYLRCTQRPDAPSHALPAARWARTPTRYRVLVGCRRFAPPALLRGGAVDEVLGQSPAGGSGVGTASRWLLFGCCRLAVRPALNHWCQSL